MMNGPRTLYGVIDKDYGLDPRFRRSCHILGEKNEVYIVKVEHVRDESVEMTCLVPKKFVDLLDS